MISVQRQQQPVEQQYPIPQDQPETKTYRKSSKNQRREHTR